MLEALLEGSDKVLMDLRSFSAHNAGQRLCRSEMRTPGSISILWLRRHS